MLSFDAALVSIYRNENHQQVYDLFDYEKSIEREIASSNAPLISKIVCDYLGIMTTHTILSAETYEEVRKEPLLNISGTAVPRKMLDAPFLAALIMHTKEDPTYFNFFVNKRIISYNFIFFNPHINLPMLSQYKQKGFLAIFKEQALQLQNEFGFIQKIKEMSLRGGGKPVLNIQRLLFQPNREKFDFAMEVLIPSRIIFEMALLTKEVMPKYSWKKATEEINNRLTQISQDLWEEYEQHVDKLENLKEVLTSIEREEQLYAESLLEHYYAFFKVLRDQEKEEFQGIKMYL